MAHQRPEMSMVEALQHFILSSALSDMEIEQLRISIVQEQQRRRDLAQAI